MSAAGVPEDKAVRISKGEVAARARGLLLDCAASVRENQGQVGAPSLDLLLRLAR